MMKTLKSLLLFLTICILGMDCIAAGNGAPIRLIVWDGEQANKGAGWTNDNGHGEISLKPQTVVAHSGNTALEMRCKGTKWLGAGWNWTAFTKGEGTDVRAMKRLTFWARCSGKGGDVQINLLCGGQQFDTPEHHTQKVSLLKYCPSLLDGDWHNVVVPLADLPTVPGYDPTKVAELQLGVPALEPVDCSFFIDDIGFDAGDE